MSFCVGVIVLQQVVMFCCGLFIVVAVGLFVVVFSLGCQPAQLAQCDMPLAFIEGQFSL